MSIFNQFPYTNVHEMNLDWVIKTVKNALENVEDVVSEYFADHLDSTLTDPNKAAQAYATGQRIGNLESSSASMGLRLTLIEDRLKNDIYDFTLSKSNPSLDYADVVTTSDDMAKLYDNITNSMPVFCFVDGVPYKARTAGANAIVLYNDVPAYQITINKTASTGTAIYLGFVKIDADALSYISGTYDGVQDAVLEGTYSKNIVLHDLGSKSFCTPIAAEYTSLSPGVISNVTVHFSDGTGLTFDPDGTITATT